MVCKNCGKTMPKGQYFCENCGVFLYEDNTTQKNEQFCCYCGVAKFLNEYKQLIIAFLGLFLIIKLFKK